jgi:hypothetical protein
MLPISLVRGLPPSLPVYSGCFSAWPNAAQICSFSSPYISLSIRSRESNTTPGAIWAGLVPTVIAVAVYFCFADFVLISQCLYYNKINATRTRHASIASVESEQSPLLTRRRSSDTISPRDSRRRRSTGLSADQRRDSAADFFEAGEGTNPWVKNTLSILMITAAGTAGWAIAWQSGVWGPTPKQNGAVDSAQVAIGAQVLGYFSAVCYLG